MTRPTAPPTIKPLRWTVPGYFYAKSVAMVAGKRRGGKSLFVAWFAAMVSRGRFIDGTGHERKTKPLNVMINVVSEDPIQEFWHPRLKVAGADMSHIRVTEHRWLLPESLGSLRDTLLASRAAGFSVDLLVLDSLSTHLRNPFFGFRFNRLAMTGLVTLAEQLDMSIVLVHHFRKGRASTVESAIGGQGILQQESKAIFVVSNWPTSTSPDRVLACEGINGPTPASLLFTLKMKYVPEAEADHPYLQYVGPIDVSARQVYEASRLEVPRSGQTGVQVGASFIHDWFAKSPQPVRKVQDLEDDMRSAEVWFSKGTAERARAMAGLVTIKDQRAQEMLGAEYAFAAGDADGRTRWCFLPGRAGGEKSSPPSGSGEDPGEDPDVIRFHKRRPS